VSKKEENIIVRKEDLKQFHEQRCYMGWREPPLGSGESAIIICAEDELSSEQLVELAKTLRISHFSEETLHYVIEELDRVDPLIEKIEKAKEEEKKEGKK